MRLHIHNFIVAEVRKIWPKESDPYYYTKYHYCVDRAEVKDLTSKITDGREYFIFKAHHDYVGWAYSRGKRTFLKWEKKGVNTMAKKVIKKAALKGAVKGAAKGAVKGVKAAMKKAAVKKVVKKAY